MIWQVAGSGVLPLLYIKEEMKMKEQRKSSMLRRWTAFLLAFALILRTFSSPMEVHANPYGGGDSNCTYTAWRLAYENTGIQLPAWGNAHTWYNSARNAGYTVSTVPRAKSIMSGSTQNGGRITARRNGIFMEIRMVQVLL